VVPLTILRWPLAGAILSIVADTLDIIFFQLFGFPSVGYHELDKVLDLYYLTLEAIVVQRWDPFPRGVGSALYTYRLLGVALFVATGARALLLLFPNLFELFFLFKLVVDRVAPAYELTPRRIAVWLLILLVPKLIQEYILHYAKVLDRYVALDIIRDVGDALIPWRR
jgi:hypothetical protein